MTRRPLSPGDERPPSLLKHIFQVDREDIGYIRFTLESYDGMAMVTTLDPQAAWIQVLISPGCEKTVLELLSSLKYNEGLRIQTLA